MWHCFISQQHVGKELFSVAEGQKGGHWPDVLIFEGLLMNIIEVCHLCLGGSTPPLMTSPADAQSCSGKKKFRESQRGVQRISTLLLLTSLFSVLISWSSVHCVFILWYQYLWSHIAICCVTNGIFTQENIAHTDSFELTEFTGALGRWWSNQQKRRQRQLRALFWKQSRSSYTLSAPPSDLLK